MNFYCQILLLVFFFKSAELQCQGPKTCYCKLFASSTRSASSSYSPAFTPDHAGIDNEYNATTEGNITIIENGGSWRPLDNDTSTWFIVDFGSNKTITNVTTKGNAHFDHWISKYRVYKQADGVGKYTLIKTSGNSNGNGANVMDFLENTRYLRIKPINYNINISLRIEVQGCDKVDGMWSGWGSWLKCRSPCDTGIQFRWRSCTNPAPNFLGDECSGSLYSSQNCNTHLCIPVTLTLELLLPGESWSSSLIDQQSSHQVCVNLKENFTNVYIPAVPIDIQLSCNFFKIGLNDVGVTADLTFNKTDPIYNLKLQDGLYYDGKISSMQAILTNFTSTQVPYPPVVTGYEVASSSEFKVNYNQATYGPETYGITIYYRLNTTDPNGEWSITNPTEPKGSCDGTNTSLPVISCTVGGLKAFHNYTVRLLPYSFLGFGFSQTPFWVTTKEDKPSAPGNFSGVMDSSTTINVTWDAVPLIDMNGNSEGYQLGYKRTDRSNWQFIRILDHWTTFQRLTGLEEYMDYDIKIRSKNSVFWGDYATAVVPVRTDEDIPAAVPTNVRIYGRSSTSVTVQWDTVPYDHQNGIIINYKINISLGSSMTQQFDSIDVGTSRNKVINNLLKWTHYTVQVSASTVVGVGPYSASKTGRTLQDRPIASPGNFHGAVNSSSVVTTWWQLIPFSSRNGVITKYRVSYFPLDNIASQRSTEFNGETLQTGVVQNLLYWTYYNFSVAARTYVGYGPESNYITLRTEEHSPTRPPENFRGINSSSYSISLNWDPVLPAYRHGIVLSFMVEYKSIKDAGWTTIINIGSSNRSLELNGLFNFTLYTIKLSAATIKGYGPEETIQVRTDDAIPTLPPASLTASNTSSTSLLVEWERIPEPSRNGIILGYWINYTDLVFDTTVRTMKNNWGTLQIPLTSLEKYRYYRIAIAGFTKKGVGPYTSTTQITDEDRPSVAPQHLNGTAISATTVRFTWDLIPVLLRNGIITKYRITYISIEASPHVGSAEFSDGSVRQGTVSNLRYWTVYNFTIAARTSKGYGIDSSFFTLRTQEHVPTRPPVNFVGFNTSSYSIRLTWEQIQSQYRHGIILGYRVAYISAMDTVEVVLRNEGNNNVSVDLRGLYNYTDYNITLSGYNSKGDGASEMIVVRTEEQVPSQSPATVNSYNSSSTSLWIEWTRIPEAGRRGIILGYIIQYTHLSNNVTLNKTIMGEGILNHNLTGLDEYRWYRIEVAGFTKIGFGPYIVTTALTDEDAPAAAPAAITGRFTTSTGLSISWSSVPDQDQNGLIKEVTVFFKLYKRTAPVRATDGLQYFEMLKNVTKSTQNRSRKRRSIMIGFSSLEKCLDFYSSWKSSLQQALILHDQTYEARDKCINVAQHSKDKYSLWYTSEVENLNFASAATGTLPFASKQNHHRSRRSLSNITSFLSVSVPGNATGVLLNNLDPYVNYTIALQATTSKGAGPLSEPLLIQTDESVPTAPPQNLTAAFSSSTSILASWQPVTYADSNGIVYAYIVSIRMANSIDSWINHTQYEPLLQFDIPGLHKHVNYSIKVAAVTSKGSGPFSPETITHTDQDLPSLPPANVTGEAIASKTLRIKWKPVPTNGMPSCCLHGWLIGYELWYTKRYPVAGDNTTQMTLPPNQLSIDISNLVSFTPYTIDVAAKTIKGHGVKTRIHVWTDEAKPIIAPQNVSVVNASSTSLLIEWNELPFMLRKGEIRGYAIYFKITRSNHPLSVKWLDMYHFTANYTVVYRPPIQIEINDVIRRLRYELQGLMKFMKYTIHLTAYTRFGTGPWTFADYAMTDEDVPSLAAVNVTGKAINSSAILVSWDPIPITYNPSIEVNVCCVHGNLTGYTIFYSRITKDVVHNKTMSLEYLRNISINANATFGNTTDDVNSTKMSFTLTALDASKNYSIHVAGNTIKGHGVLGDAIYVATKENVPTREPSAIRGWKVSSTQLYVEWDDILWEYRNGIIIHYIIYYRQTAEPQSPEISKIVNAKYNSTILYNLKKWTFYTVRVYGATSKGQGKISANITLRTDEDVPSEPPQNVKAIDYTGPYSIFIRWSPVPVESRHGVILGYRSVYEKISEADEDIIDSKTIVRTLPVYTNSLYLEYLPTFCTYRIQISAFTSKGNGPLSEPILAKTCRCVKHLYTNWWNLPPYNYEKDASGSGSGYPTVSDLSFVPKGLFAGYLRDMVIWSCGNCNGPRGHGYSVVHFDIDKNGKRSQKPSETKCIEYVDETVDFTFPLHGRTLQTNFLTGGKFLPFADHPDSAMVVLKKVTVISRSTAMKNALMSMWPLIVVNVIFATVAGFFIWSLDCRSNPDEFPSSLAEGVWAGFWWAYVTMTTVGYGDITPRSFAAKIFSILWIFTGLVLYAILVSTITSALYTKQQVLLRKVQLYDTQVALINGSFEEKIAIANSAKPVGKKTVTEILDMVKNDQILAAFVDTYILSLHDNYFGTTPLYVQQTLKSKTFSYGIGLMGNITKLSKLFLQYKVMTQSHFASLIEQYVSTKKKDESTVLGMVDDDDNMFSASSPVYKKIVFSLTALICIASAAGIIITVLNLIKNKRLKKNKDFIESIRTDNQTVRAMEHLADEANSIWGEFEGAVMDKINNMENIHLEEKLRLIYIYRHLHLSRRKGLDVTDRFNKHQIKIKDWEACYKEMGRMKTVSETANGMGAFFKTLMERRYAFSREKPMQIGTSKPIQEIRNLTNITVKREKETQNCLDEIVFQDPENIQKFYKHQEKSSISSMTALIS